MRRIQLLVKPVQRATENELVGSTAGISEEEYYQYFSDGQALLQRRILAINNKVFRSEDIFSATGSERYDNAPPLIFARNMVVSLEYSASGLVQSYYPLKKRTQSERFTITGSPSQYALESGVLLINAYPQTGTFRRVTNYKLPRLDKRRATVGSFTASATALTALTITGMDATDIAAGVYSQYDYLTLVGWDGTVKMRGVPFTTINTGTGVVTILAGSYTFPTGSTIAAGDYVCFGEYASTHSALDDQCEDFMIQYCMKRIFMRDSSMDVGDLETVLEPLIESVLELYSDDPDVQEVPVTNYGYFEDLD